MNLCTIYPFNNKRISHILHRSVYGVVVILDILDYLRLLLHLLRKGLHKFTHVIGMLGVSDVLF
jgi:hypothetical protein